MRPCPMTHDRPSPTAARSSGPTTATPFVDDYEWLRDKESPDVAGPPRGRERLHRGAHRPPRRPARADLRRDQGAAPRRPTCRCRSRRGDWWYYGRTVEGKQYGAQLPLRRSPTPTTGPPPSLERRRAASRASRCCSTPTSSPRATTSSRSAPARSAPTAGCWPTAPTPPATSGSRCGSRTSAPASCCPTRSPDIGYGATWDLAGEHLFYTTVDEAWRPDKVWRHRLGTDPPRTCWSTTRPTSASGSSVGRTRSDRFLVIGVGSKTTSEYRLLDADDPTGEFRVVAPAPPGRRVLRRARRRRRRGPAPGAAQRRRPQLRAAPSRPVDATSHEQWQPAARRTTPPSGWRTSTPSPTHLVRQPAPRRAHRSCGCSLPADGARASPATSCWRWSTRSTPSGSGGNPEFAPADVRFGYTTLVTPSSVLRLDLAHRRAHPAQADAGARRLRPDGLRAAPRVGDRRRRHAGADLDRVPRRARPRDGIDAVPALRLRLLRDVAWTRASRSPGCPCSTAAWSSPIAHVRGGGEMGRHWYDDGKMLHKRNTFTDFVACARHLADDRLDLAGPARRRGRQRRRPADGRGRQPGARRLRRHRSPPCPFVDALTSILDPSLPLTVIEWEEWGNPLEDPEVYAYMKSYSPYENVADAALPADPGRRPAQRHPGAVRRARQVGGPAARHASTTPSVLLKTEMSAGPRRRQRALQRLEGPRLHLRLGARPGRSAPLRRDRALSADSRALSPESSLKFRAEETSAALRAYHRVRRAHVVSDLRRHVIRTG